MSSIIGISRSRAQDAGVLDGDYTDQALIRVVGRPAPVEVVVAIADGRLRGVIEIADRLRSWRREFDPGA